MVNLALGQEQREFEYTEGDTTYVMKQYVFCLYLSGDNRDQSEEQTESIQAAHLKHIDSMVESHGLQIAGPLETETEKRGILIFDLPTIEDAEDGMASDPAVKAGRLRYECYRWWAAKGSTLD